MIYKLYLNKVAYMYICKSYLHKCHVYVSYHIFIYTHTIIFIMCIYGYHIYVHIHMNIYPLIHICSL